MPRIEGYADTLDIVRQRLAEALANIWDSIEPEYLEILRRNMPSRMATVMGPKYIMRNLLSPLHTSITTVVLSSSVYRSSRVKSPTRWRRAAGFKRVRSTKGT
jgi:hypothetical protein